MPFEQPFARLVDPAAMSAIASLTHWRDIVPAPWKNLGGRTRELCVFPPDADVNSFVWRASVADVDADGDFSVFPDIDRTIVLLEGTGFGMLIDGVAHDLRDRFAPFSFAGEAAVSVRLHGGATRDFNLMVRRSHASGEIVIYTERDTPLLPAGAVMLHVTQGNAALHAADGAQLRLRHGDTVRFQPDAALPALICDAGAVVLAVAVDIQPGNQ